MRLAVRGLLGELLGIVTDILLTVAANWATSICRTFGLSAQSFDLWLYSVPLSVIVAMTVETIPSMRFSLTNVCSRPSFKIRPSSSMVPRCLLLGTITSWEVLNLCIHVGSADLTGQEFWLSFSWVIHLDCGRKLYQRRRADVCKLGQIISKAGVQVETGMREDFGNASDVQVSRQNFPREGRSRRALPLREGRHGKRSAPNLYLRQDML